MNVETEDVDTRPTTPTPSTVQTAAEHMSRGVESSNSAVLDPSLEHHVVKAVNIPGPVHRPHHHLHHPSAGSLKEIMSSIENEAPATIVNQSEMSPDRSSSTSDTSDDEDDEDEDEDHEREEESDTEADDEEELDKVRLYRLLITLILTNITDGPQKDIDMCRSGESLTTQGITKLIF